MNFYSFGAFCTLFFVKEINTKVQHFVKEKIVVALELLFVTWIWLASMPLQIGCKMHTWCVHEQMHCMLAGPS